MIDHGKGLLVAILFLILTALLDLRSQPRGMVWTEDDFPKPVGMSGPVCPGFILASNTLTYTDHGIAEGYFAIGQGFTGIVRPGNPALDRVRDNLHKDVELVLRVKEPRKLQEINR